MTPVPTAPGGSHRPDPVARTLGAGALLVALLALVFAMTGSSSAAPEQPPTAGTAQSVIGDDGGGSDRPAARPRGRARGRGRSRSGGGRAPKGRRMPGASTRPRPFGILRLDRNGRIPRTALPKVDAARTADRLGDATVGQLMLNCPADSVDLGSWCLDSSTFPVPPEDAGKNDFMYATKKCVERGGYLPTAAQLIGAAERVKLSSTIDDSDLTASIDETPDDGRKDQREMSSTLFTTTAGSSAAGSQGPTAGSRGNPLEGEPDPIPQPADPAPSTLQYVTVYDNRDKGGFAGGRPVGVAERFRCAFDKSQGEATGEQ